MGKCSGCGFLALRNRFTGVLDEAPKEYRKDGAIPELIHAGLSDGEFFEESMQPYSGVPICFAQGYDLIDEVVYRESKIVPEAVQAIVNKERPCPLPDKELGFIPWIQGSTPKEHREMMDRERMLKWQAQREDADRKHRHSELKWVIGGVIVAVAAVIVGAIATILGSLIEAGILFN